ncbi:MAG: hypothetical protein AAB553_05640 [Patescibacteria group bacterium]
MSVEGENRQAARREMDNRLRSLSSVGIYGRANDAFYEGFTTNSRGELNELGYKAERLQAFISSWRSLLVENLGKGITTINNRTRRLESIGVILPIDAQISSRHLIILNKGRVIATEATTSFDKKAYLEGMSPTGSPIVVEVMLDNDFDTTDDEYAGIVATMLINRKAKILRSSEKFKDIPSIEGMLERAMSTIALTRKKRERFNGRSN